MMLTPIDLSKFSPSPIVKPIRSKINPFNAKMLNGLHLNFSGKTKSILLLDYHSLDPSLSDAEVAAYQDCERKWHEMLSGLEPNEEGLNKLIQRAKNKDFKIKTGKRVDKHLDKVSRYGEHYQGKIKFQTSATISTQFYTLAHELVHGLHDKNKKTRTVNIPSAMLKIILSPRGYLLFIEALYKGIENKKTVEQLEQKRFLPSLRKLITSELIAYQMEAKLKEKHGHHSSSKSTLIYAERYRDDLEMITSPK